MAESSYDQKLDVVVRREVDSPARGPLALGGLGLLLIAGVATNVGVPGWLAVLTAVAGVLVLRAAGRTGQIWNETKNARVRVSPTGIHLEDAPAIRAEAIAQAHVQPRTATRRTTVRCVDQSNEILFEAEVDDDREAEAFLRALGRDVTYQRQPYRLRSPAGATIPRRGLGMMSAVALPIVAYSLVTQLGLEAWALLAAGLAFLAPILAQIGPGQIRDAQTDGITRSRSRHVTCSGLRVAARPSRARLVPVTSLRARSLQHVRPVVPLLFPESEPEHERMGQSGRHYRMCNALYEILRAAAGDEHTVSCDAFVYFDAADPRRVLAPDGAVKLDVRQHDFDSWKTWERGAPELAVEILSPSDSPERWTFEEKLQRYRALGVCELVVFHADGEPGSRLRVWDRIDGDLVERSVTGERTPCLMLDAFLVVAPILDLPACLRLAHDADGLDLVPTAEEARRDAEARLREAERRIAELEASRHE